MLRHRATLAFTLIASLTACSSDPEPAGASSAAWTPSSTSLTLTGHAWPDIPPAPHRFRVADADARALVLGWAGTDAVPRSAPAALSAIDITDTTWNAWLKGGRIPAGPWKAALERSALVLRGLTYAPTGLPVAAATTSLPETPGGERNWDYRYCWIRDSTFTLQALHFLNLDWEADEFMQFIKADVARMAPVFKGGGFSS